MSHTRLPWTLQKCGGGGSLLIRGDGAGKHPQFSIQIVPQEDAALIVRAVNCHDELLEACKSVAQLRASIRTWAIGNRIPGWQNEDALFESIQAAARQPATTPPLSGLAQQYRPKERPVFESEPVELRPAPVDHYAFNCRTLPKDQVAQYRKHNKMIADVRRGLATGKWK